MTQEENNMTKIEELEKQIADAQAQIKSLKNTYKVCDLKNISVLAYANNFTLWHYTTIDLSVNTDGYFNNAASMLRVNDLIIANINTDSKPSTVFYIVTANTGSAVTVKPRNDQ